MIAALIGATFGLGVFILVSNVKAKPTSLDARVSAWVPHTNTSMMTARDRGSFLTQAAAMLDRVLGGSVSITRKLQRLNSDLTVGQFRSQQIITGCLGFLIAVSLGMYLMVVSHPPLIALVVLVLCGFVVGVLARDQYLTHQVNEHERRQSEEFPTIAELLALAVAAGEPPSAALERVVEVTEGELSQELRAIVSDIRTGTRFVDAFDALAARTGVTSIARFAESLAIAVERGTPLIDVLHAQAADVRESARRSLIETAARKEIAMMVPVVFLLLPVTVVIAFYPGFIGLSLGS